MQHGAWSRAHTQRIARVNRHAHGTTSVAQNTTVRGDVPHTFETHVPHKLESGHSRALELCLCVTIFAFRCTSRLRFGVRIPDIFPQPRTRYTVGRGPTLTVQRTRTPADHQKLNDSSVQALRSPVLCRNTTLLLCAVGAHCADRWRMALRHFLYTVPDSDTDYSTPDPLITPL